MRFSKEFFEEEIRDGFTVTPMVKRAWAVCIEVLSEIDRICKKHDIKYFAYYGTLLGAVRHGGFVPWDDDVDIVMLRKDFEKFSEVAPGELQYGFKAKGHIASENDYNAMSSVVSKEFLKATDLHEADPEEVLSDPQHGCPYIMGVDIYAFDYLPDDPEFWNTQRMLHMAAYDAAFRCDELEASGELEGLAEQLAGLIGVKIDPEKPMQPQLYFLADRIASMATEAESSSVVWMQTTAKSDRFNNIDKHKFDRPEYIPFENIEVPVPADREEILTVLFGDYKTPVRFTSGHDYPVFKKQDEWLRKRIKPEVIIGVAGDFDRFGRDITQSKKLPDEGVSLFFPEEIDTVSVAEKKADEMCNADDFAGYDEFEAGILRVAEKVRGFEIDRLTGVDDHRSFYYEQV